MRQIMTAVQNQMNANWRLEEVLAEFDNLYAGTSMENLIKKLREKNYLPEAKSRNN